MPLSDCPIHGPTSMAIGPGGVLVCLQNLCGYTYNPTMQVPAQPAKPVYPLCLVCGFAINTTSGCANPICMANPVNASHPYNPLRSPRANSAGAPLAAQQNNLKGLQSVAAGVVVKPRNKAIHWNKNVWKCWAVYSTGCSGEFPHGTKECNVCGRLQDFPKIETQSRQKCSVCPKELSSYLDAYFGKDPEEAKKCTGCRK